MLLNSFNYYGDNRDVKEEIANWFWKNHTSRILNIISVPYNNSFVFLDIILEVVAKRHKVLYISNEPYEEMQLMKHLRKLTSFRNYGYIKDKNSYVEDKLLIICNHENSYYVKGEFDLVIYDDSISFSDNTKEEIQRLIISKQASKSIICSIETIFNREETIEIPIRKLNIPMVEPRIITTKINISKEIPFMIYDYLKWFIKSKRKVIIYAPDSEKADDIYEYLKKLREDIKNVTIRYSKDNERKIQNLLKIKDEPAIIVVESLNILKREGNNLDIIVYFADHKVYSYKRLTYICGKAGIGNRFSNSEVIFLANNVTSDMDIAKDIVRNFNKMAWERGLLNI